MAKNSIIEYVGDGSTIQYTINFTGGYTSEDHVFCQVNNEVDGSLDPVYRTLTFISAGLVSIGGTTPALDDPIVFSRVTPIATPVVDFEDGVVFTETDIDAGFEQVLFGIQEAQDNLQDAVATEAALASALVAQAAAELAETNAEAAETNVAADLVLTNADVVLTNADVVLTAADVVTSAANAAAAEVAKIEWQGTYAGGTTYAVNDAVVYNSSSYICILASTGNLPTNGTYWDILALKGTDGAGSGDMLVATYDPTAVGGDAFDMDNMTEGTLTKVMTGVERSKLAAIEAAADVTDETNVKAALNGATITGVTKADTDQVLILDASDGNNLKQVAMSTIGGGGGLFKGDNGEIGTAPGDIFRINNQTLTVNTTIDADENASATGPLVVDTGVTLTIASGGTLVIL